MEKKWRSYIFHPLFIGLIISSLVVFIFVRSFPVFKANIEESFTVKNNGQIYYCDLDNDGNSEQIHFYQYDRIFDPTLYLYDSNNNFKFLWNFNEIPVNDCALFVDDFNDDSKKEIFTFTHKSDSIFLYIIDPEKEKNFHLKRRFIESVDEFNDTTLVKVVGLYDLNNDGLKELLFYIDASYPFNPRKIFSFDISENRLVASPNLDVRIANEILVKDLDGDGHLEIFVPNNSIQIEGNGNKSKMIVLNHKLHYKFAPINFNGQKSKVTIGLRQEGNNWNVVALNSGSVNLHCFNNLVVLNSNGKKILEKEIKYKNNLEIIDSDEQSQEILLLSENKLVTLDDDFRIKDDINLTRGESVVYISKVNLLNNKLNTYLFKAGSGLILYSLDSRHPIEIDNLGEGIPNLTLNKRNNENNILSAQFLDKSYLIGFVRNEAFVQSVLFQILVIILIIAIVYFISKLMSFKTKVKSKRSQKQSHYSLFEKNLDDNNALYYKDAEKYKLDANSLDNLIHEPTLNPDTKNQFDEKAELKSNSASLIELIERVRDFYKKELEVKLDFYPSKEDILLPSATEILVSNVYNKILEFCVEHKNARYLNIQFLKHEHDLNITFEIESESLDVNELEKVIGAKKIKDNNNWSIEIRKENKINTIHISVPLTDDDNIENDTIKVIIAEDHDVSLFGLISLFKVNEDIEVIGTAKNGMEVLKILENKKADVVITDISMPGMDGIELSEKLQKDYPDIKVIVFTMYMENWFIEQLVNNGVIGFVSKNSKINELIGAVKQVNEGLNYYCPQFKTKFGIQSSNQNGSEKKLDSLTKIELQVIRCFADNLTKEQIAKKLKLNIRSVNDIVANILLKINAGDEDEIVRIAKRQKFISE